jgi:hypothetical protein
MVCLWTLQGRPLKGVVMTVKIDLLEAALAWDESSPTERSWVRQEAIDRSPNDVLWHCGREQPDDHFQIILTHFVVDLQQPSSLPLPLLRCLP